MPMRRSSSACSSARRDVGQRRNQLLEVGVVRLEHGTPMAAVAAGAALPVARTRCISLIPPTG